MALTNAEIITLEKLTGWPEKIIRKQVRMVPIEAASERETQLKAIVTEYNANELGTTATIINTEGVKIDPDDQRILLGKNASELMRLPSGRRSIPGKG